MTLKRFNPRLSLVYLVVVIGAVMMAWARGPDELPQKPTQNEQGKVVTMEGRIVDLQCFMSDKYDSKDHRACTEKCIRAGVPCGLATGKGLVILGTGNRCPSDKVAPFAFEEVRVSGKYYEREGVKYLDVQRVDKKVVKSNPKPTT